MVQPTDGRRKFFVEIIRPSRYDDDGYVVQWLRAFVPSNSLACLYGLVDAERAGNALGDGVDIVVNAYDEGHTVIPTRKIIRRIRAAGGRGVVFLAGVQTNQFARAVDLARQFREAGVHVVIGGFHVSGSLAMLSDDLPDDIRQLQEMGVSLFAGEAEGRMAGLLRDAYRGELKPVYNFLGDPPGLGGQPMPTLPDEVLRRYMLFAPFDAGRGCPFKCSFCTIINVQGRKMRHRGADDVEKLVRAIHARGIRRFFITDDNMSRNRNWEAIFDRLIELREREGLRFKFMIQVDTMSHKVPGFIEKATRAGCNRVFIGMESVNPDNLAATGKVQNRVDEYRKMLLAWRRRHVLTFAGYILGLPHDTPESIERDIRTIQRELPIDILEFFILTPLPGSADHKALCESGAAMDSDLNRYDTEHVVTGHALMGRHDWQAIYDRAWHLYYSPEHVQTLLRRGRACGAGPSHVAAAVLVGYGSYRFERVHPLNYGIFRRKVRATRRPGLPRGNALAFYARRAWEFLSRQVPLAWYALKLERLRKQIMRDPAAAEYTDPALEDADQEAETQTDVLKFPAPAAPGRLRRAA